MIETLYRHHTYLEMYYLAGFLGIIAYFLNNMFSYELDFLLQCSICTTVGTLGEGLVGNLFNKDYHMWDYRDLPFSFWNNQINLFFILIWFILFIIVIPLLDYVGWKCWNEPKPYYKIFKYKIHLFK